MLTKEKSEEGGSCKSRTATVYDLPEQTVEQNFRIRNRPITANTYRKPQHSRPSKHLNFSILNYEASFKEPIIEIIQLST